MSAVVFGQLTPDTYDILGSWHVTDPATLERILIFGAIGLVTLLVLLWAALIRKRRRRRRLYHHSHDHSSPPVETPPVPLPADPPSGSEKRHGRHSHRRRRRRNPTLAETGGLPPVRPAGPPEAQP